MTIAVAADLQNPPPGATPHPGMVPNQQSGLVLPYGISVVPSADQEESAAISNRVITCFEDRDFDKLDDYASNLRTSKVSWATGHWKLGNFYCSFCPADTAPDSEWKNRLAGLDAWVAAKPDSITARVALANFLIQYAWAARGSGWGDTVTDEGWRLFNERLNQAEEVLDDAGKLKEKCPVYWSMRMTVALGLNYNKDQFDEIFKQATNATPNYQAYYFHRAVYLLPRWNGSPGEWEADLAKEADQVGGDQGDELYARVVWCMHQCVGFKNIFKENNLDWPRVDRGFDIIEKQYPASLAAKNEHAHLAVLSGNRQAAVACLTRMAGKVDLSIWYSEADFIRQLSWAYNVPWGQ
ncbi:MAG TPA: DUF4034 domain-containing protein [Candidatus Acidoferrales bacterium]|nr:DUF4034 domain-containing protein [Candidatus Acidoferrales bacterium]